MKGVNVDKRVKLFIAIEVVLVIVHRVLTDSSNQGPAALIEWHFVVALIFGLFLLLYVFSLKCPNCKSRLVVRGWKFSDLRFPGEMCHKCGHPLN